MVIRALYVGVVGWAAFSPGICTQKLADLLSGPLHPPSQKLKTELSQQVSVDQIMTRKCGTGGSGGMIEQSWVSCTGFVD